MINIHLVVLCFFQVRALQRFLLLSRIVHFIILLNEIKANFSFKLSGKWEIGNHYPVSTDSQMFHICFQALVMDVYG